MRFRSAVFLALGVFIIPLFLGCGKSDSSSSGAASSGTASSGGKKYRIAVIPKGTSHDFWKSVHFGADKAAQELGVEIIWMGTNDETDKEGQIKIVDNFVAQQVDGICLAPIDRDAFVPVVRRAKRREIPTVVFDSALSDDSDIVSYVATNNYKGGGMAAEYLAKAMNEKGGVILLRYQSGSESTEQREQGFLDTIAKYKNIKVLSESQRVNSDAQEALKIAGPLLRSQADELAGVFTVCEPNNKGMLQALEGEKLAGKIKFVAFDSDPRILVGLEKQSVDGVVLQDPVRMGYLAVKTMVSHLKGEKVEKRVETGEVLATPENMKEEKVSRLLKPKQFGE